MATPRLGLLCDYLAAIGRLATARSVSTGILDANGTELKLIATPGIVIIDEAVVATLPAVTAGKIDAEHAARMLRAYTNVGSVGMKFANGGLAIMPGLVQQISGATPPTSNGELNLAHPNCNTNGSYEEMVARMSRTGTILSPAYTTSYQAVLPPIGFANIVEDNDVGGYNDVNGTRVTPTGFVYHGRLECWSFSGHSNSTANYAKAPVQLDPHFLGPDTSSHDFTGGPPATWFCVALFGTQLQTFFTQNIWPNQSYSAPVIWSDRAATNWVLHGAVAMPPVPITLAAAAEGDTLRTYRLLGERVVDPNETIMIPFTALGYAVEKTASDGDAAANMDASTRDSMRSAGQQMQTIPAVLMYQGFNPGLLAKRLQDWLPDASSAKDTDKLFEASGSFPAMTIGQWNSKFAGNRYNYLIGSGMAVPGNPWNLSWVGATTDLGFKVSNGTTFITVDGTYAGDLPAALGDHPSLIVANDDMVDAFQNYFSGGQYDALAGAVMTRIEPHTEEFPFVTSNMSDADVGEKFVGLKTREDVMLAQAAIALKSWDRYYSVVLSSDAVATGA